MAVFNWTPQLVATGTIRPYAVIKATTTAWGGAAATAAADYVLGVADGSTRRFDSANNAESGDPISMQPSPCVQVVAAAAVGSTNVAAGDPLMPDATDANGAVSKASGAGNVAHFVALEPATASGQVFWAYRLGSVKAL